MEPFPPQKRKPPSPLAPPGRKGHPRPQDNPPPKKEEGDGADHPIVGTKVHVPDSQGVEVGTLRGVHRRKAGVVWVEYPDNGHLYEVARNLLFPSLEVAHEHFERVRKPKAKASPPPPPSSDQLDPRTDPLTNPKQTAKITPRLTLRLSPIQKQPQP